MFYTDMIVSKTNARRAYLAPASDVSELLENVMICESGTTEDWVVDEQEF